MDFLSRLAIATEKERAKRAKLAEQTMSTTIAAIKQSEDVSNVRKQAPQLQKTPTTFSSLVTRKRKRSEDETLPTLKTLSLDLSGDAKKAKPSASSESEVSTPASTSAEDVVSTPRSFAPAKRQGAWGKTALYKSQEIVKNNKHHPEWYANTNTNQKIKNRGDLQVISHIKTVIFNCIEAGRYGGDLETRLNELRMKLHDMEFSQFKHLGVLVKRAKVLEEDGLVLIFEGAEKALFPWDIVADAKLLHSRWMSGHFDSSLLRGLDTKKGILESGKRSTTHKVKSRKPADVVGANGLINGQWWPLRVCAFRDGAHGELEAGIHGKKGRGAFAIVVANGGYADEDRGDLLKYCGTRSDSSKPTANTTYLEDSFGTKQVIRVLRKANKLNDYAPKEGLRYDGLYVITDKEILEDKTAMFRFTLKRVAGQDPIRYQGKQARPTPQELKEWKDISSLLKG